MNFSSSIVTTGSKSKTRSKTCVLSVIVTWMDRSITSWLVSNPGVSMTIKFLFSRDKLWNPTLHWLLNAEWVYLAYVDQQRILILFDKNDYFDI